MRIGFFSPTINKIGGGELVTLNMIDALRETEHESIIYSAEKINREHIKKFLGHSIMFDKEVTIGPNFGDPYILENIYPNLFRSYLFHLKCDVLIDTFSNAVLPWVDAVYFQGNPQITKLPKGGLKASLFIPYKNLLKSSIRNTKSKEKTLLTCSNYTAKTIKAETGSDVKVLYPPVPDFFKIRHNLSLKSNDVVTVIRMSSGKRPETIAQIAKLAPDNLSFIVITSCRLPSELKVLQRVKEQICKLGVKEKVQLLINVSREKQREVLQKAKVYIHPFVHHEAFGISIVEAMSAGCIPVVPNKAGPTEYVPKHLRYDSLEEAASLIEESIANWSLSKVHESVEIADNFSQKKFCENFLKIMRL